MTEVKHATDQDLATILGWLETEYYEDGESGFWCNRHSIEERHREWDDLYVVRQAGEAVAFQTGEYSPSISSTRKDVRRLGYATALFEAGRKRAIAANVNLLDIECTPRTSWPFWQNRGFVRYGGMGEWATINARMELVRHFDLPRDAERKMVHVAFYPEEKKWSDEVEPIRAITLQSAMLDDGLLQLPRRAVGIVDAVPRGDMVVEIVVDSEVICCEKAKYADGFGVQRDTRGGTFYLDCILLSDRAAS